MKWAWAVSSTKLHRKWPLVAGGDAPCPRGPPAAVQGLLNPGWGQPCLKCRLLCRGAASPPSAPCLVTCHIWVPHMDECAGTRMQRWWWPPHSRRGGVAPTSGPVKTVVPFFWFHFHYKNNGSHSPRMPPLHFLPLLGVVNCLMPWSPLEWALWYCGVVWKAVGCLWLAGPWGLAASLCFA